MPDSPIQIVTFGEGMSISLNNYYDILKQQAATLQADEFLQLKLVADGVDISEKVAEGSYEWFSYYNLLKRSDLEIEPSATDGKVMTGAVTLHEVYGKFLRKLRSLIVLKDLNADEQKEVDAIDLSIDSKKDKAIEYVALDTDGWKKWCAAKGADIGDKLAYFQWSSRFGKLKEIEELNNDLNKLYYQKKTILNRKYPNPDDEEVINAESLFDNPSMRLRYPIHPDYNYSVHLTAEYLGTLPTGSTALFDDRLVVTYDKTLEFIKNAEVGVLKGHFDRTTESSNTMTKDWGSSGSVGWGFISVKASASEHTTISDDFKQATEINLACNASIRLNINFGPWFNPNLFNHIRVIENPEIFKEFFGPEGSLLYYPTALILLRGFEIEFIKSSNWTYNYDKSFNASAGGGFSVFGINFGGSSSYGSHTTEHTIDQTTTSLKISDDKKTLRFVGYAVKKNKVMKDVVKKANARLNLI